MSRQMTVAIAGLGSRGRDTYAKAAKIYPDKMKIVAIADIDPEKVKLTAEEYDVPMSHCYESAEDMLKEEKLADAMIIATQDRQHVGQAIKALKKGYHLLLEKPISPDLGECRKISEVAKEKCIFDAEKIYLEHERIGYRQGNRGWPLDVLVPSGPTEEKLIEALKTGPYGKCVFHCNNNVVDHQVVNLNMTDGTTMSFTMCGFTAETSRYAKFMGTRGEVIVDMQPDEKESKIVIEYFDPGRTKEIINVAELSEDFSGHGGGDNRMVEEFLDIISGEKSESTYITSLDRSLQSHYCALAAEYSRLHDGKPVDIETFR